MSRTTYPKPVVNLWLPIEHAISSSILHAFRFAASLAALLCTWLDEAVQTSRRRGSTLRSVPDWSSQPRHPDGQSQSPTVPCSLSRNAATSELIDIKNLRHGYPRHNPLWWSHHATFPVLETKNLYVFREQTWSEGTGKPYRWYCEAAAKYLARAWTTCCLVQLKGVLEYRLCFPDSRQDLHLLQNFRLVLLLLQWSSSIHLASKLLKVFCASKTLATRKDYTHGGIYLRMTKIVV